MRKRGQHGKFRQVQFNIHQEVDQSLDTVLRVFVQAEENRAFNPDAMVVIALDTVADIVGGIENSLVNIPAPA